TFFYDVHRMLREPFSFPTRRSSDLRVLEAPHAYRGVGVGRKCCVGDFVEVGLDDRSHRWIDGLVPFFLQRAKAERHTLDVVALRSEEHTSELQSRENLVCRLLLEK